MPSWTMQEPSHFWPILAYSSHIAGRDPDGNDSFCHASANLC